MTPELRAVMEDWLANGDETQRRHATFRLGLTTDPVPIHPTPPTLPPPPVIDPRAFRNCPYSSDFTEGCCSSPATVYCHWFRQTIQLPTCIECLSDVTRKGPFNGYVDPQRG